MSQNKMNKSNKKNSDYWERRKAELVYQQMDKAELKADEIDQIYNRAQAYLSKQADKVFDKFRRDYGLSEVDARQVLKDMKGKLDLSEMRKVLEARPNDPNINQLLADMDSAAYAFRINRLKNLSQQVEQLQADMYQAEKAKSDQFYPELMKDSYHRATFDLQQQTGIAYQFNTLPEAEIKRLSALKWSGDNYSSRIWNNTGELARRLKNELLVSWMTGGSNRDVVNSISEQFDIGKNKARRLVRTESAFFHNEMEVLSYADADIEKYRFVAVLDRRTSSICREHDHKVYKLSERKTGVNYPPMHPWCRSTTIAHFDDMDLSKLERSARDPETGKTRLVPADMSYDDWYEEYVEKANIRRMTLDKAVKSGKIVSVSGTTLGHKPPGKEGVPNSVVQHNATNGDVLGRTYYDDRGYKMKDVHFTNHKQPDKHPFGSKGEHVHDYIFDDEGKFVSRNTREITEKEREENLDILWRF